MKHMSQTGRDSINAGICGCILIGLALVVLSGCKTPSAENELNTGTVKWSEYMVAMGYVPVFPPREDIRVGDLLYNSLSGSTKKIHASFMVSPSRWSAIEVGNLLEQEYGNRSTWPATPEMYYRVNADPEARTWDEALSPDGQSIFADKRSPLRLRPIAAGIICAASDTYGSNYLIPSEAINLALGTSWQDEKSISLRAGNAEGYSLSLQKLLPLALEQQEVETAPEMKSIDVEGTVEKDDIEEAAVSYVTKTYLKKAYLENLTLLPPTEQDILSLFLVNEVIYIRNLDIVVQTLEEPEPEEEVEPANLMLNIETTDAAETSVELYSEANDDSEAAETASTMPSTETTVEISGSTDSIDPALVAYMRAQMLNTMLMKGDSDDMPDEFVRFISVTDRSAALRRTWRYGLAVGMKGVELKVNKQTGEVVSSEYMIKSFRDVLRPGSK
jgi:hypothetical protein